jgi:pimeloyl-ACP methyl ester carboxylesterase
MFRRLLAIAVLVTAFAMAAAPATAVAIGPQREFTADWVRFDGHRLYVRDYPGRGPAFVLMHGFPHNLHLYDRVVPLLRGRRTVTFDFLGWGRSDKPRGHTYTFTEQEAELDDVVQTLRLRRLIPVVHDASGPAGINWSLSHPGQVAALVLLNTFYSAMPTTNPPEVIRLFSDPSFGGHEHAIPRPHRSSAPDTLPAAEPEAAYTPSRSAAPWSPGRASTAPRAAARPAARASDRAHTARATS